MTARHPTFIVSNGKGSSYLFRSIFPKDLRKLYNYPNELRISLNSGIKTEAMRLAGVLKNLLDNIFSGIRSGNITETCVSSIKEQLRLHLKTSQSQLNTNGYYGVKSALRPLGVFSLHSNKHQKPMKLPSDYKLVRDYVSKFRLEDIKAVCDYYDIEYEKGTFPRKHLRQAREKLIKLIDKDMGLTRFANHLSTFFHTPLLVLNVNNRYFFDACHVNVYEENDNLVVPYRALPPISHSFSTSFFSGLPQFGKPGIP